MGQLGFLAGKGPRQQEWLGVPGPGKARLELRGRGEWGCRGGVSQGRVLKHVGAWIPWGESGQGQHLLSPLTFMVWCGLPRPPAGRLARHPTAPAPSPALSFLLLPPGPAHTHRASIGTPQPREPSSSSHAVALGEAPLPGQGTWSAFPVKARLNSLPKPRAAHPRPGFWPHSRCSPSWYPQGLRGLPPH